MDSVLLWHGFHCVEGRAVRYPLVDDHSAALSRVVRRAGDYRRRDAPFLRATGITPRPGNCRVTRCAPAARGDFAMHAPQRAHQMQGDEQQHDADHAHDQRVAPAWHVRAEAPVHGDRPVDVHSRQPVMAVQHDHRRHRQTDRHCQQRDRKREVTMPSGSISSMYSSVPQVRASVNIAPMRRISGNPAPDTAAAAACARRAWPPRCAPPPAPARAPNQ